MKAYYTKYKENGLCGNCGKQRTDGVALCDDCKKKRRERDRQYRAEKRNTEFCSRCLKNPRIIGRTRCEQCSIIHKQESAKRYYQVIKADPVKFELESKKNKDRYLQRKFGITLKEYDVKLASQNGVCQICHDTNYGEISLAVDHNHQSGMVRGLLCNRCNTVIGLLRESPALLRSIELYLGEEQCQ